MDQMNQGVFGTEQTAGSPLIRRSSVREAAAAYLSLFTSLATVFCCSLPAFLVLIGLSFTSVLAFFTAIPGWQKFGQHETWYYLLSGALLALGFYFSYFWRSAAAEVCEIPAGGRVSACSTATRWNRRILWFSLFLYSLAVVMNFWGIGWMKTHGYFNH